MWQWFRDVEPTRPMRRRCSAAYQLALLYCDEGRWEDAERCLAYGRDVPVPAYFRHEAVLGLAARARLAAHRGRLAEAVRSRERAVELAERSDMLNLRARVWLALAEVQQTQRRAAEADAAVADGASALRGERQRCRRRGAADSGERTRDRRRDVARRQ